MTRPDEGAREIVEQWAKDIHPEPYSWQTASPSLVERIAAYGRAAVTAIARHNPSRLIAVDDSANFLSVAWEGELARLAPLAGGDHAFPALVTADVVVRSPGVPQTHPWMKDLRERGVTVTGGSALWMADHAARTIGVTGRR